jgi:hypothetical protein
MGQMIHSHVLQEADLACEETIYKFIALGKSNRTSSYCMFCAFISNDSYSIGSKIKGIIMSADWGLRPKSL